MFRKPKPDTVEKKDDYIDPFDPDLDIRQLYLEHIWAKKSVGSKFFKYLYYPMWKLTSKDFQQATFLGMKKEERVKIIKERAKSIMASPTYFSLPKREDIIGRDDEINTVLAAIYYHILRHPDAINLQAPPKVFLVKGEPGSGKSYLAKVLQREAFDRALEEGFILDLKQFEGASVNSPFMGMYSGAVSGAFADAQKKPTFLWVDEAGQLVQKGANMQGDSASKEYQQAESAVLQALDNIMASPVRTIVMMGSNSVESLREDVRRRCFVIDLDTPGLGRDAMLKIVTLRLKKLKLDLDPEQVLSTLEQELRGLGEARMVPHDLARAFEAVVDESEKPIRKKFLDKIKGSEKVTSIPITLDSFKAVVPKVRAYKEQMLTQAAQESEQTVPPPERYRDVGGLKGIKEEVIKEVTLSLNPIMAGDKWKQPRGYLFYGPAGTGKTLLAKAIAGENKVPIFVINAVSIGSGVMYESEKSLRQVFTRARLKAPSIIFMDEIDSIGRIRGSQIGGNAPGNESLLTTLLTQLDGFNPKGRVVFIGATNRKDILDDALLQRLDKKFEFVFPKTTVEKLDVINAQWLGIKGDSEVTSEQIIKLFLAKTFSPRVCADVLKEAARMAQMESIACRQMALAMENFDGPQMKSLKGTFGEEFERIFKRYVKLETIDGEIIAPEPKLQAIYDAVAISNPITMEHLKLAFDKEIETDAERDMRRFSEMHRSQISEVGKGYGLATDLSGTKGIFLPIEVAKYPAERKGRGTVNCLGNIGQGPKESAWIARDLIRKYDPTVMDWDFTVHIVSLGEGTENVAISGPSAGQAIFFSMLSAWLNEPFNFDVCVTGKVDLNGIVGMVGGIQPKSGAGKLDAARENHFKYILIPEEAMNDLKKDWQDYIDASLEAGTQIVGGKTWTDYAKFVFPKIGKIEERLGRKA